MRNAVLFPALISGLALTACGESDSENSQDIEIKFSAVVGSQPFACGTDYVDVGTATTTFNAHDLRFYVHDVELIDDTDQTHSLTLTNDGKWQNDRVALLDFEDGCMDGTTDTNASIKGTIDSSATITGLRFKIGVPEEINHNDQATAESPLNLTGMFWSWMNGYKHLRLDGQSTGLPGYRLHLGSTACSKDAQDKTTCTNSNRPSVELSNYSADKTLVVDVAKLLGESDLNTNTMDTPPGCMSGPTDPECQPIFKALGLSGSAQSFISVP